MPLPFPHGDGDKESRGRALVVGAGLRVPGALLLSGIAALRAGAGKLQVATPRALAIPLGLALPEALVVGLPAGRDGEIAGGRAPAVLRPFVKQVDAMLVGPGMLSVSGARAIARAAVEDLRDTATLVLDAAAIEGLRDDASLLVPLAGRAIVTPHAGEMAALLDIEREDVMADPPGIARLAADTLGAVVVLKGADSFIALPGGELLEYRGGNVGLATSGSGDTLAGIIAGLAARGADPLTAAAWGVWAHGTAGERLARRTAPIGFLARELLAEIPKLVGRTPRG